MEFRQAMNGPWGALAALAALAGAAATSFLLLNPPDERRITKGAYFFDLGSNAVFVAEVGSEPPIDAPSGPSQGVRAYVYACDKACGDAKARFVGYLETQSDESRSAAKDAAADLAAKDETRGSGRVVSKPSPIEWIPYNSEPGRALMLQAQSKCGQKPIALCQP